MSRAKRAARNEDTNFVAALISSAIESVMIISTICAKSLPRCTRYVCSIKFKALRQQREPEPERVLGKLEMEMEMEFIEMKARTTTKRETKKG